MVFLSQIGTTVAGVLVTMLGQLATDKFLKAVIVRALGVVVKKTQTPVDDQLLNDAKRAWGVD